MRTIYLLLNMNLYNFVYMRLLIQIISISLFAIITQSCEKKDYPQQLTDAEELADSNPKLSLSMLKNGKILHEGFVKKIAYYIN